MLLLFVALSLPIQSMAFFFGGVALPDLLIATLGLIVSVLLFSTFSLYISTRTRTATLAIIISYALLIVFIYVLPALALFVFGILDSRSAFRSLSELTVQTILYIGYILMSCNPFGAAIMSGLFWRQTKNLDTCPMDYLYPLLSPCLMAFDNPNYPQSREN